MADFSFNQILDSISIHALVKRATTNGIGANICGYISIHALVKRATYPTK